MINNSIAYKTQKFNSTFTRALQWSPSWAKIATYTSLRLIFIYSSHVSQHHLRCLFLVYLSVKFLEHSGYMYWLSHFFTFNYSMLGGWYKLWSAFHETSFITYFLHSWVQIFALWFCSQIIPLCVPVRSVHVSHPYTAAGDIKFYTIWF